MTSMRRPSKVSHNSEKKEIVMHRNISTYTILYSIPIIYISLLGFLLSENRKKNLPMRLIILLFFLMRYYRIAELLLLLLLFLWFFTMVWYLSFFFWNKGVWLQICKQKRCCKCHLKVNIIKWFVIILLDLNCLNYTCYIVITYNIKYLDLSWITLFVNKVLLLFTVIELTQNWPKCSILKKKNSEFFFNKLFFIS